MKNPINMSERERLKWELKKRADLEKAIADFHLGCAYYSKDNIRIAILTMSIIYPLKTTK
jgi:hypothetical protein